MLRADVVREMLSRLARGQGIKRIARELGTVLEHAAKRDVSDADFLDDVLGREVGPKTQKHLAMRIAMARFPFQKTLETSATGLCSPRRPG